MKLSKKVILLLIVKEIKNGKSPSKIANENNIKKQTLQYYLRQLKKEGIIEKESYGVWNVLKEVSKTTKASQKKYQKQIRGHAFNWRIRFPHNFDWRKRLDSLNIKYKLIGINGSTPRIIYRDKKIWFTKTGLIIYEPKSFFSASSFTSKGQAVWELDKTIKSLGRRLKFNLGRYEFTTSREHYGQIKNELARQYNDKGEKLYIRDDKGIWLWIDNSHSLQELETNKPEVSRQVQNWYNDHKKHDFEITSSFILDSFANVIAMQTKTQATIQSLIDLQITKNNNPGELNKLGLNDHPSISGGDGLPPYIG